MEFIKLEQFKEQPKEIQEVFREWWKPQMYDLFARDFGNNKNSFLSKIYIGCIQDNETLINATKDKTWIPMLTEGQLRKFIEDKTGKITFSSMTCCGDRFIEIENEEYHSHRREKIMDNNLLQAYWKYSCRVAVEGLHENNK